MAEDVLLNAQDCKLTLYESLAVGGHSQVFRGELVRASGQKCQVAAKKVRLESMEEEEICCLKQLSHKNIIIFHGVYAFNEGRTFIIMELAENGDLYRFLMRYRVSREKSGEKPRLPADLIWKWVMEAAFAIQYLHSKCHNHRDIKSQNYLVMGNYTLKLGDLGMAKKMEKTQQTLGSGTCGWMAPEVIKNQLRSRKSDVFSFGVVVWEICTTDVPYSEMKGDFKVMQAVCAGRRPKISEDCPEVLADIMKECWETEYNNRPEMAAIVLKVLPHQTDVAMPRILELKMNMKDAQLKAVSPPSSITKLEPDEISFAEVLNDKYLLDLAGKLGGEWEQLGTYLDIQYEEMYRIKCNCRDNVLGAMHQMLIRWRQRQSPEHGLKQVAENLSQALASCKRHDLAHKVLEVIPESSSKH